MRSTLLAFVVLALSTPAFAAGGGSRSGFSASASSGNAPSHTSSTPGTSRLPRGSGAGTSVATTPFAWVDDASILSPGDSALSTALVSWHGTDASETNAPVIGVAAGVAPRLQLSARVPFVVANDTTGLQRGVGTSYISGKIALLQAEGDGFNLSVAPTVQLLGTNITLPSTESRAQWGLPVSAEVDSGSARVFASAGYFSGGIGFAGGGASVDVTQHVSLSGSLSHSWLTGSSVVVSPSLGSDRTEIAGGVSLAFNTHLAIFGSVGQTIATTDANGAGMTMVAGLLFIRQSAHH